MLKSNPCISKPWELVWYHAVLCSFVTECLKLSMTPFVIRLFWSRWFGTSKFIIQHIFKIKHIKYALRYSVICPLWSRLPLFSCSQHHENLNFMLQITVTEQSLYHGLYFNVVDNVKICRVECWVINQKKIVEEGVYVNWVDPKWNRWQRITMLRTNREYKYKEKADI